MSKALVIKGANFLANRVEQISVSDPIPCTGIALSQNTIEFTQIGATATLVATLTPTDTTEALSWVSSDEDVATVSNGVVTCTGIGTATITAICGPFVTVASLSRSSVLQARRSAPFHPRRSRSCRSAASHRARAPFSRPRSTRC